MGLSRLKLIDTLVIVALALALRLWQIDLGHFDFEQSILLEKAAALVSHAQIPVETGLNFSIGVREPPLTTFLLALPMVVSDNPAWIASFQAALDGLGALFLYALGRDLGGRWAGVAAGTLYAVSPAAIFYSRMIWNPQLVSFFSAVGLWGTVGFAMFGDARRLAIALFAAGCAAQLHLSAAVQLIPIAAIGIVRWRDVAWQPLAVAVLGLGALLTPYIGLQLQSDWSDVRTAVAYAGAPKLPRPEAGFIGLSLLGGDFHRQPKTWWPDVDSTLAREPLLWVMLGLLALGILAVFRARGASWLLPVWLALPVLAGLRHTEGVYPHYLLALIPAAAALAGVGLASVRPVKLGALLLVAVVGWRLVDYSSFQQDAAEAKLGWLYGVPLRYTQQAVDRALEYADGGRLFAGVSGKSSLTLPSLVRRRAELSSFDSENLLLLHPNGGIYITDTRSFAYETLREHFGPVLSAVTASDGTPLYAVFRVSAEAVRGYLSRPSLVEIDADFEHVIRVRGYELSGLSAGESGQVVLMAEVSDPHDPRWPETRMFAHIVDQVGRNWSRTPDSYLNRVGRLEEGDRLVLRQSLDLPTDVPLGGYWLETGFYRFNEGSLSHLRRYEESRADHVLRIGPTRIEGNRRPVPPVDSLAVFGDTEIELHSAEIQQGTVTLTWISRSRPQGDYTVFVHALDRDGRIIAQHDSLPAGGSYPTLLWRPGDVVQDHHVLAGMTDDAIRLAVGLYSTASLERLAAAVRGGPAADHVLVPLS
ncbi:MAG: glycosyltransferase family 39 protein [Chloroflexi bacterium]|nr:glycosyltransferase family 39 protein [Chloroflexota bacterium]